MPVMTTYYAGDKGLWTGRGVRFGSLPSTNTWALEHLSELQEGYIIRADTQTAGRGRFGRAWLVVSDKCLAFSLVLKDPAWIPLGPNLGQVAAWAVSLTLVEYGIKGQLKWPNDVMVHDRKISGILVERGEREEGFVVGIGLNVNGSADDFRLAGMDRPATSLEEAAGRSFDREDVMEILRQALTRCLEDVRERGLSSLWRDWSCQDWLKGQTIEIRGVEGDVTSGECLGISPDGALRLRTLEGYERVYWTGDVERIRSSSVPGFSVTR